MLFDHPMMQNYENNLRLTIILPTLFIYFSKNTTINVYCLVIFQNAHDSSPSFSYWVGLFFEDVEVPDAYES